MLETVLFYAFSAGAVVFSLGVILFRSPIYSVLSLVGAMGMVAGLFALLKAYLVATILVLVYAGAILVLFLFIVMLADFKKLAETPDKPTGTPIFAGILSLALFVEAIWVIRTIPAPAVEAATGTAENIGRLLFGRYVFPFELTSFLLLAAVTSVVVLAKKEPRA